MLIDSKREPGPAGPQGEVGLAGSIVNYTDYFLIMPPDNSATETTTLTITPNAGGTEPVSAHLIIIQMQ